MLRPVAQLYRQVRTDWNQCFVIDCSLSHTAWHKPFTCSRSVLRFSARRVFFRFSAFLHTCKVEQPSICASPVEKYVSDDILHFILSSSWNAKITNEEPKRVWGQHTNVGQRVGKRKCVDGPSSILASWRRLCGCCPSCLNSATLATSQLYLPR